MATLRHNLANIVSVPVTFAKLIVIKAIFPKSISFSPIERFSPNVVVDLDRRSRIAFGKRVSIHSRSRISVNSGGQLSVKDHTSFNVGCIVTCHHKIQIGRNVSFGPNVMIFDHDHMMHKEFGAKNDAYACKEIVVGDNTWIGAGTIILAGAHIGENCVIAAGSVVKGTVPDNSVLIQKRVSTYKDVKFD